MTRDAFIENTMWDRINRELAAIEHENSVRVLIAVESGSRAWRFPSRDSDYDVRFVYIQTAETYLLIEPPRDVIERPIDGLLDINGWDIRKALQLLVRANAVIWEWLTSPVRYRDADACVAQMLALTDELCHLPAFAYHYDRLARHSFAEISAASDSARLKTYCYAMRPALALVWIRQRAKPPPMDVPSLLEGIDIASDVRRELAALIERKAVATEDGLTSRIPALDAFLGETLAKAVERSILPDRAAALERANALFLSMLRADTASGNTAHFDG
jgi:uncharacterized protein